MNLYGFAGGNPVNESDPNGTAPGGFSKRHDHTMRSEMAAEDGLSYSGTYNSLLAQDAVNQKNSEDAADKYLFIASVLDGTVELYGVGKVVAMGLKAVAKDAVRSGASGAARPTNRQLVQAIATRAERKIGGTGAVAGTAKHKYAQNLLNRYQSMYRIQGLVTEESWLNGARTTYGRRGSSRFDVRDINTNEVFDYKFVTTPPGLSTRQSQRGMLNGPTGTRIYEINP